MKQQRWIKASDLARIAEGSVEQRKARLMEAIGRHEASVASAERLAKPLAVVATFLGENSSRVIVMSASGTLHTFTLSEGQALQVESRQRYGHVATLTEDELASERIRALERVTEAASAGSPIDDGDMALLLR